MSGINSSVSRLRTRLEAGRWQLKCDADALSESLDAAGMFTHDFHRRPLYWAAAGLAGGFTLSRLLPPAGRPPAAPFHAVLSTMLSIAGTLLATSFVRALQAPPPGGNDRPFSS